MRVTERESRAHNDDESVAQAAAASCAQWKSLINSWTATQHSSARGRSAAHPLQCDILPAANNFVHDKCQQLDDGAHAPEQLEIEVTARRPKFDALQDNAPRIQDGEPCPTHNSEALQRLAVRFLQNRSAFSADQQHAHTLLRDNGLTSNAASTIESHSRAALDSAKFAG
jgi:hypothetical protein